MIRLQTTGRHYELDDKIIEYIDKKLGGLDKYLPRHVRGSLAGTVILECNEALPQDQRCICEVQFEVKGEQLKAHESTINMYAAIDICEQKLKSQALTYKSKHEPAKNRRQRLMAKVMGRTPLPEPVED